jgi:hypothetical protein
VLLNIGFLVAYLYIVANLPLLLFYQKYWVAISITVANLQKHVVATSIVVAKNTCCLKAVQSVDHPQIF